MLHVLGHLGLALLWVLILMCFICAGIVLWFRVPKHKGKLYIVFEGIDGSGKETQSVLLEERLLKEGYKIKRISYPEYSAWHSFLVRWYLQGKFGKDATKINPYVASFFYAFDRFFSMHKHSKDIDENTIVIFDRYTTSNMLLQVSKIDLKEEDRIYNLLYYLDSLEHGLFGIPRLDLTVLLDLDYEFAMNVLKTRGDAKHSKGTDIHESSALMMKRSAETAIYLSERMENWARIPVTFFSIDGPFTGLKYKLPGDINNDVYTEVSKLLK